MNSWPTISGLRSMTNSGHLYVQTGTQLGRPTWPKLDMNMMFELQTGWVFWMSMTGAGHLHDYVNHEMLNICRETSHYIFVKQQVTKKEKHSKASYYTKRNFYRKVKITLITWCENVQLLHYETTAVIQMLFLIMNILFLFAHWSFIWTQNW